jgi:hypothetical protein
VWARLHQSFLAGLQPKRILFGDNAGDTKFVLASSQETHRDLCGDHGVFQAIVIAVSICGALTHYWSQSAAAGSVFGETMRPATCGVFGARPNIHS